MANTFFEVGQKVITPNAATAIWHDEIRDALFRHEFCDFGDISDEDKETNHEALKNGGQVLSAYTSRNDVRFWIITEVERPKGKKTIGKGIVTTILLPEEY